MDALTQQHLYRQSAVGLGKVLLQADLDRLQEPGHHEKGL